MECPNIKWNLTKECKPKDGTYCLILSYTGIGIEEYSDFSGFCSVDDDEYSITVICDNQEFDICNEDVTHWVSLDDVFTVSAKEISNSKRKMPKLGKALRFQRYTPKDK